ncbi:DNA ligase D [Pseudogracilibacillus sp. ICA-222130]|uniref:DNA ligase D n=1 Tax=Pseudogracilibacillus sp. ICA-222130 TaxID=3134655 RepID=UPI0030C56184
MNVMKPIAIEEIPKGDDWLYEVKYDGFRCVLHWERDGVKITNRNNKDLSGNFPEIINYCHKNKEKMNAFLPVKMDGELVVLNNPFQANFSWIQKRGRLKNEDLIRNKSEERPVTFMAFDLLQYKGEYLYHKKLLYRKQLLKELFTASSLKVRIQFIHTYENGKNLWKKVYDYKGEGLIAKRKNSVYLEGKKHRDWYKIKNWRKVQGFLTHMDMVNGYFLVSVYDGGVIKTIGKCKHGLNEESMSTLKQIFITKGDKQGDGYSLLPAICVSINTLDLHKGELREPSFKELLPNTRPEECTIEQLHLDMAMIPPGMEITNTNKVFWPDKKLTKGNLLTYIREVSPYMLPFLRGKALTVIRSPDGVLGESFFQKNLPSYAPEFIKPIEVDGDKLIVCDTLDHLVWFANHGAMEYHIPFQTLDSEYPNEIVFDLDPPDRERFDLAIRAALIIKLLLDRLNLISFVKTSGNKGLQVHIPIPVQSMTYEETALFTQAIAWTLENNYSDLFTTERLKKNRKGRLYIDYVQHGKNKTLIAPYSPRKTADATVATPLFWQEIREGLVPDQFTIENVVERIHLLGCPFDKYFEVGATQEMNKVLTMIQSST